MKKSIRLFSVLFFLALFFLLFALSTSAAPSGSDYDIWVGGVPVTYDNADDVLGDGRVVYDHTSRTLTIDSATLDGHVSYYAYDLSVFCNSDYQTTVVIKGKCHFAHGIRVAVGDVLIRDADLTFSDDAMTAIILYHAGTGLLSIENSTVRASAAPMDALDGEISLFYAGRLEMTDSDLLVTADSDDLGASLIHVKGDLSAVRSRISVQQDIPVASIALYTEGEVAFTDCTLDFGGAIYTLYAPIGSLSFLRSEITIRNSFYALCAAELAMTESSFDAEVFYDGIYVASADTEETDGGYIVRPTELMIDRSTVRVRQLAYSRLKGMLAELWATMDDTVKIEQYGGSYETFLSSYASDFATETAFTAGLSAFCASISVLESSLRLEKFTLGLYASGDSSLYVSDRSSISLDGEQAAFVFFAERANAVTVSDRIWVGGDLFITETALNLSSLGRFLYVYADDAPSYDKTASYTEESPESLFRVIGGVDATLKFSHEKPSSPWLWIAIGGVGAVAIGGALTTFLCLRSRAGVPAKTKSKK